MEKQKILKKRIDNIEQELSIIKGLYEYTLHYKKSDPKSALSKSREAAEAICQQIYKNEGIESSDEPEDMNLDKLLGKLTKAKKVPSEILAHLRAIQFYGNLGPHHKGVELHEKVDLTYTQPCLHALADVVKWYFEEYRQSKADFIVPEIKKQSREYEKLLEILKSEYKGRLAHVLYNGYQISLDIQFQADQVESPYNSSLPIIPQTEVDTNNIMELIENDSVNHQLLILGQPGAGKTSTVIKFALEWIEKHKYHDHYPVPILFECSRWEHTNIQSATCKTLLDWLAEQLKKNFRISKGVAKEWIKDDRIFPIFDGLDEIDPVKQHTLMLALNSANIELRKKIVTCRFEEYKNIQEQKSFKLQLHSAILLVPLSEKKVEKYLGSINHNELWTQVEKHPKIQDLIKTPLFLYLLLSCYHLPTFDLDLFSDPEEFENFLLGKYLQHCGKQKTRYYSSKQLPFKQEVKYLNWLARILNEQSKIEFSLLDIQPKLLQKGSWLYCGYGLIIAITFGLAFGLSAGLLFGLSEGMAFGLAGSLTYGLRYWIKEKYNWVFRIICGLTFGFAFGLSVGLVFGLSFGLIFIILGSFIENTDIKFLDRIHFPRTFFNWVKLGGKLVLALGFGLSLGLIGVIAVKIKYGMDAQTVLNLFMIVLNRTKFGPIFRTTIGIMTYQLAFGLAVGMAGGIIVGLMSVKVNIPQTNTPNKSINYAILNGLFTGFLILLFFYGGRFFIQNLGVAILFPNTNVFFRVGFGICFFLSLFLVFGGGDVWCHYILRLSLSWRKDTPFRFIQFLNHCTQQKILHRIGGNYRFIHAQLQNHIAQKR
jgi:hypothetical protein